MEFPQKCMDSTVVSIFLSNTTDILQDKEMVMALAHAYIHDIFIGGSRLSKAMEAYN
jgi:hypothetical protein